jgi:hypothetical protein
MRFAGAVIFLLWTAVTAAGIELTEVVARCGEKNVRREEVMPLLRQASTEDMTRLPRRELLKKVLTEHFCSEALLKMLTDAGFPPDAEKTLEMMKKSRHDLSSGTSRLDEGTLYRLSREPKVQLQWAFRRYLQERRPDIFLVPPAVIERYYRENQQMFLLPPQITGIRYSAGAISVLNTLLLRVRQGEAPERVANSIGGIKTEPFAGAYPDLAGLPAGAWGRMVEIPGGGYTVCRVSAVKPAAYVPMAKAAPLIREMIARRRAALELERALKKALDAAEMEFYF